MIFWLAEFSVLHATSVEAKFELPSRVGMGASDDHIVDDPGFEHFLRWMARLPLEGRIEAGLRNDFRSFLEARRTPTGMRLRLQDCIVVARAVSGHTA